MAEIGSTSQAVQEIIDNEEVLKRRLRVAQERVGRYQHECLKVAEILARSGGLPHKEKNEAMLAAIAELLRIGVPVVLDMDDLPF